MRKYHGFNEPAEKDRDAWKVNCFTREISVSKLNKRQ